MTWQRGESVAESSSGFNNVTRQIAREDILNNQRRESFKSYIPSVYFSLWCTEISHRVINSWIWRMFKYSNAFIGKKVLEQKALWAGALSWCSIQTLFFQRFCRFFHKVCRTVSLLIQTMSTIFLTLRRRSLRTISLICRMFWLVFKVEGWPGC